MKLKTLVTEVLLSRFALSVLWFVLECGQKGHSNGQLDEQWLAAVFTCCAQGGSFAFVYIE
jgi:hypothetical protein